MVVGRKNAQLVPLAGASLDKINMTKRIIQGWVISQILDTVDEVIALDEESDSHSRGQGLAEYALILALIAIVAIAALILLGGQIADILQGVGEQIPGTSPAP